MTATIAYPSVEQFLDLFNWASPGLIVTTADGEVVIANKAATELLGEKATKGTDLPAALGINDYAAYRQAGKPVENIAAAFANPNFPSGYANVGFAAVSGTDYAFWALRPVTSHPTPAPQDGQGATTAQSWINQVDAPSSAYVPVGEKSVDLLKAYYDTCPVAIHLIAEDGTVEHANWKDIALVGATDNPTSYVGHHIRHIYADQPVVEDFLGRWGEDAPIIDFRADFMDRSRDDERVPVVIFSTAKVEDNTLKNTRCFVFSDSHPTRERDKVKALDLDF
ncbi:PAS domain-containing protein [Streptomyces sp. NPDC093586]|uniref:PAS domain-containing protein n=1 Tax=Streptomyces sp. NPDC093586 TaxID=3366042 RepID=UPI0037FE832F